jgi:hypothetical protein
MFVDFLLLIAFFEGKTASPNQTSDCEFGLEASSKWDLSVAVGHYAPLPPSRSHTKVSVSEAGGVWRRYQIKKINLVNVPSKIGKKLILVKAAASKIGMKVDGNYLLYLLFALRNTRCFNNKYFCDNMITVHRVHGPYGE